PKTTTTPSSIFVPAKPPSSNQTLPSPVIAPKPSPSITNTSNTSPTTITIEREYSPTTPRVATLPPVMLDPTTGKPFQYRVIVPNTSTLVTQKVKAIVPDAFRLSRSGRMMLQVGAYSDRPAANQLVQKLAQSGVSAEIISFR
ncbi:MAG: SPOR domain-containing protein, partial [Pseudanabaena sp.]